MKVVELVELVELVNWHLKSGSKPSVFDTFDLEMCFAPQRRALFGAPKAIWTSKSGPYPRCFATFFFEMCFAPQRRALFRHRNVQKWSGADVFCTFSLPNVLRATMACTFSTSNGHLDVQKWSEHQVFWHFLLPNVLRATTACTFSTSQLPKVVRTPGVLTLFTEM